MASLIAIPRLPGVLGSFASASRPARVSMLGLATHFPPQVSIMALRYGFWSKLTLTINTCIPVRTDSRQTTGRFPLSGAGFGGHFSMPKICYNRPGNGGVGFVASRRTDAFIFKIDPRRGTQGFFKRDGSDQRGRPPDAVNIQYGLRNVNPPIRTDLLFNQFMGNTGAKSSGRMGFPSGPSGGFILMSARMLYHWRGISSSVNRIFLSFMNCSFVFCLVRIIGESGFAWAFLVQGFGIPTAAVRNRPHPADKIQVQWKIPEHLQTLPQGWNPGRSDRFRHIQNELQLPLTGMEILLSPSPGGCCPGCRSRKRRILRCRIFSPDQWLR